MRARLFGAFVAFVFVIGFGVFNTASAEKAPMTVDGATTVDVKQAEALFNDGAAFVDPRGQSDYDRGHIPGAFHLDVAGKSTVLSEDSLAKAIGGKDAKVVFYCNGVNCMRSPEACAKAVGWGFKNVYFFRTGFPAWKDAGLPVE